MYGNHVDVRPGKQVAIKNALVCRGTTHPHGGFIDLQSTTRALTVLLWWNQHIVHLLVQQDAVHGFIHSSNWSQQVREIRNWGQSAISVRTAWVAVYLPTVLVLGVDFVRTCSLGVSNRTWERLHDYLGVRTFEGSASGIAVS
jgi:hypothetical protein